MNIPITKELVKRFDDVHTREMLYGSRLFGVHREDSDYDIIALYHYDDVFDEELFLPNLHSFQYTDTENNKDINYMTYAQYWRAFYNGDGTMYADIVLFSDWFNPDVALKMCRAYKIIKGYCGSAKQGLRTSGLIPKVVKRCAKNLYIAECLINNTFPLLDEIKKIYTNDYDIKELFEREEILRKQANDLFNKNELMNYHIPKTDDELLNIMLHGNNLSEYIFKK